MIDQNNLFTTLDAVNYCLRAGGQNGVTTLDNPSRTLQSVLALIQSHDLAVQSRGWSWNRISRKELQPDQDGDIPLPNNTLRVSPAILSRRPRQTISLSSRTKDGQPHLFNSDTGTFAFAHPVVVSITERVAFEDLPPAARLYVAARAAMDYNVASINDPLVAQTQDLAMRNALVTLEQIEDDANNNNNIFAANPALNHSGRY